MLGFGKRRRAAQAARRSQHSMDVIDGVCSLEEAASGIIIVGAPGGGKTSTVGRQIRRNLLRLGAGGAVLCAKIGEYAALEQDCIATGRRGELVRFVPGGAECCDLVMSELTAPGGTIQSAAALIDQVAEMDSRHRSPGGSGEGDRYWMDTLKMGNQSAIAACWLVMGHCSLTDIYQCYRSAPTSLEQVETPEWRARSELWEILAQGMQTCADKPDFSLAANFWLKTWADLSDRTRSICMSVAMNLLGKFMTGPMMQMVANGETTNGPEKTLDGKILGIDMPVMRYQEEGIFVANLFKTLVQRRVLSRSPDDDGRPVFIFMDEAQLFLNPYQDMMVSTVSRESKLINVALFQNLPMLYAAMGGGMKSEQQIDGWMSCHVNKVVLANTCVKTGEYFSKLFGRSWQDVWGDTFPAGMGEYDFEADVYGRQQPGAHGSINRNSQFISDVPPEEFTRLSKPSYASPYAEGFVFQGGHIYENGKTWKRMWFPRVS